MSTHKEAVFTATVVLLAVSVVVVLIIAGINAWFRFVIANGYSAAVSMAPFAVLVAVAVWLGIYCVERDRP